MGLKLNFGSHAKCYAWKKTMHITLENTKNCDSIMLLGCFSSVGTMKLIRGDRWMLKFMENLKHLWQDTDPKHTAKSCLGCGKPLSKSSLNLQLINNWKQDLTFDILHLNRVQRFNFFYL